MPIVGGLRDRLILANLKNTIQSSLEDLGWFDDPNALRQLGLTVRDSPVDDDEELLPNYVTISVQDIDAEDAEMGSDLSEYTWMAYVDIYAEDHASGVHLCGDIRAIIEGKLPSIGRVGKVLNVYNLTLATPDVAFKIHLDKVSSNKIRNYNRTFQKHWWVVGFEIKDIYLDDENGPEYVD